MAYDTTFTITGPALAGNTVITFHTRPEYMDIMLNGVVVEHPIPGATHSIIQAMGSNSERYRFPFYLHDTVLISQVNPAPTRPQDILLTLRGWMRAGRTVSFSCDYVTQLLGEASGIDCKIAGISVREVPAVDGQGAAVTDKVANYECEIELVYYYH